MKTCALSGPDESIVFEIAYSFSLYSAASSSVAKIGVSVTLLYFSIKYSIVHLFSALQRH